jgi:hypothetical protein
MSVAQAHDKARGLVLLEPMDLTQLPAPFNVTMAERQGADFVIVECVCPEGEIKRRLDARSAKAGEASDGRWEIFRDQQKNSHWNLRFSILGIIHGSHPLTLCNTGSGQKK